MYTKLVTLNLLHFHGGGKVVSVMFGGGQLAQSANNNVLVSAIEFIVYKMIKFLGASAIDECLLSPCVLTPTP